MVVGVEVGVYTGMLSAELLSMHDGIRLFMVDSWGCGVSHGPTAMIDGCSRRVASRPDACLREAINRTERWADRRALLVCDSSGGTDMIPDGGADLVYIDAGHTKSAVLADLAAWHGKVRDGGLLRGHDYKGDVREAVDEWCSDRGILPDIGAATNWFIKAEW